MPKDYAKRVFTTARPRKKKSLRVEFIVIGVVLAVAMVGFWGYLHRADFSTHEPLLVQIKTLFSRHQAKLPAKVNTVTENNQDESVHFDFYNDLSTMQVTPSKVADVTPPPKAKPVVKVKDPEAPLHYILQLGVFKDPQEASQLRLSLLLSGCDVEIVKIHSKDGEMYRVQNGPFLTQADAIKLQKEWEKKGFMGVVKKG